MKLTFIFLLSTGLAYGQTGKEAAVGYADRYDNLPMIRFEAASKENFDKLPQQRQLINKIPAVNKGKLLIPTGKGNISLKKYGTSSRQEEISIGWQYKGYLPLLKMHALVSHGTSEDLSFSDLVLIDSTTADKYAIVSIGDAAVEVPIPSPDGRYLAYYYNAVYERNSSFIGILGMDGKDSRQEGRISEMMSFQTKEWAVEDIRWIDSSSFIVKAYTVQIAGERRTRKHDYYLARLSTSRLKNSRN